MNKLQWWLCNKFLPAWCKDELTQANAELAARLDRVQRENEQLKAYIDGMHVVLRRAGICTKSRGARR